MASEAFWGGEGFLLASAAPRFLTERSEQRLPNEDALLDAIREALRKTDADSLRAAFDALAQAVQERRLHLMLLHEISYRIYYSLASACSESGLDGAGLRPLDLRDTPIFLRFPQWKPLLWEQLSGTLRRLAEEKSAGPSSLAGQAAAYARARFREPITLKSAADACFVSPSYLGRCFQKEFSVSFRQYVNELRLEEAKRLLEQTDRRIYEIAEAAGFGESKHFVSKFTAQYGCSPAEYRRARAESAAQARKPQDLHSPQELHEN